MQINFIYTLLWGKPAYVWGGALTFLLMLAAFLVVASKGKLPIAWHRPLGIAALIIGAMHFLVGIIIYFF